MRKQRDYNAEYARRIVRGKERGLSRSQARGHPKANEHYATGKSAVPQSDNQLEQALRNLREGNSLKHSAKEAGVSEERFRRFVKGHKLANFVGRRWTLQDNRPRRVPMIKGNQQIAIFVPGFAEASDVGKHHNAVSRFLRTNDSSHLQGFEDRSVKDVRGKTHPFETDPSSLYRLAAKDEPVFHEIYQIVAS